MANYQQDYKWSYRRYEQSVLDDPVEEAGIGTTNVVIKDDPEQSASDPGIATKLYCNPTSPVMIA